jgi:hypothetical protein
MNACFVPATLEGREGDAQDFRRFFLAQALIEEKVDDFLEIFGEALHMAVEVLPVREIFRLIGSAMERSASLVGSLLVGVVVPPLSAGTEVVLLEVKQLPSDLGRGEVEKVPGRVHLHSIQTPAETDEALLEDIVRGLPTPKRRVVPVHPAGKP